MEEVRITGAGPGGLAAAITLRRHGIPVTVYEKHPDVGYRMNGDLQGLENWTSDTDVTDTLKEIGIDINFLCEPCSEATVYRRGADPVAVRSKKPIFYLVRRGPMAETLDTGLKEQARDLGARLLFDSPSGDRPAGRGIIGSGPRRASFIAVG